MWYILSVFSGPRNGNWGAWGPWGACSKSCAESPPVAGKRQRVRACDNPSPLDGGIHCGGVSSTGEYGYDLETCNENPCP